MVRLKIDPELRRSAESLSQEPSGVGRNTTLAPNQLVHPLNRNADVLSESNLRHPQRFQEFLEKNLPRMCRSAVLWQHVSLTV